MSRVAKVSMVAAVVSLVSIAIVIARSSRLTAEQQKNESIQRVKQSPDIPINFTNFDGVPLSIQKAATKEISAAEYRQLTGGDASGANRFAAFPSVVLLNMTNKRVTQLMVTVGDRQTKKWYIVNFHAANIAPQQTFTMTAADWNRDKASKAGGDIDPQTAASKIADFDAARLWWPGGAKASDLVFRVALVEFENGEKWQVDEARGSLW